MTSALAVLMLYALPGLAGAALITRRSALPLAPGTFLGRVLACSIISGTVVPGVLARTVGLSPANVWSAASGLAGLSLVAVLLPGSRAVLRLVVKELVVGASFALVGFATWLPIGLVNFTAPDVLIGSTPWYYAGLAKQIAVLGGTPQLSHEWGTLVPFLDDYHLLSVSTAAVIEVGPSDGIAAAHAFIALTVVLGACGIGAFSLRLGAQWWGALLAVPLLIGTDIFAVKFSSYRPEAFGTVLVFPIAVLLIDYLHRRERASLVAAGVLFAVLAQIHGLVLITCTCLVGGAVIACAPSGGLRSLIVYGRHLLILGGTMAVSVLAVAAILGTRIGSQNAGGLQQASGLADPTWEFTRAIRGLPPSEPPGNAEMVTRSLATSFLGVSPWFYYTLVLLVLIGLVVAASADSWRRSRWTRLPVLSSDAGDGFGPGRILLLTLGFVVLSAAVASFFALGWQTYVPRRAGDKRLLQVLPLLLPALCAIGATLLLRLFANRPARGLAVSVLVAGALALGTVSSAHLASIVVGQRPDRATAAALRHLHLPTDAVVLVNGYTEGTVAQLLGARGLTEGRAPYTYPQLLDRANRLLKGAADFYRWPRADLGYLRRNNVSYVVYVRPGSWALGTSNIFQTSGAGLRSLSELAPVLKRSDVWIYRVHLNHTR